MPVCNPPGASSLIGQTSTSCLKKFTIHFRRPTQLKQKKGSPPYKGHYGFDWLRDEYIYPIEIIEYDKTTNPEHPVINYRLPLCLNPKELRKEYLKITDKKTCDFKPYKQDYYPAWLSIFACDVQGNNADAGSDMHKDGVYLDLQLDEIDKISNDDTEIFFEPSVPCLKITPEKISISEFLKTKREERILDKNNEQPKIYYYKLENAVKIICQGDTLKQHEMIKVFAKLGPTKIEVGRLMVYKNDNIGKANIFVVNVITEYDVNNKVSLYQEDTNQLIYLYNNRSFNQAMIKVKIKATEDFDLVKLQNETNDEDIIDFLHDIKDQPYLDDEESNDDIFNRLSTLYQKYGKHSPKNINSKDHTNYYSFFTTINYIPAAGIASIYKIKTEEGNIFGISIIFKGGLDDEQTIVHEVGHSFSLPHTFDSDSPHIFYQGYTDNHMDYFFHSTYDSTTNEYKPSINPYNFNLNMHSFFKWQWDLMRKDLGIEKSIKDE